MLENGDKPQAIADRYNYHSSLTQRLQQLLQKSAERLETAHQTLTPPGTDMTDGISHESRSVQVAVKGLTQ